MYYREKLRDAPMTIRDDRRPTTTDVPTDEEIKGMLLVLNAMLAKRPDLTVTCEGNVVMVGRMELRKL